MKSNVLFLEISKKHVLYTHNHNDINNNSTYTNTKHRQTQIYRQLCYSGTNAFINFWLRFFDKRRETILKSFS